MKPPASRGLVLALLLLAYIFNFVDRQILGILGPSIQADLHLSNSQFGAIGGTAFALLYPLLGIPLAYLADRTSRSSVVAASVAVWSGFTALCGAATGYWSLFLCRVGVGVGEAGGVAPSYALIAEHFPAERRARALAIFSLGVPLGLGGGAFVGARLGAWLGWRSAFAIMERNPVEIEFDLGFVLVHRVQRDPLPVKMRVLCLRPRFFKLHRRPVFHRDPARARKPHVAAKSLERSKHPYRHHRSA